MTGNTQMTGTTLSFESVEIGQTLEPLRKGPMTTSHIMRWSSAMENWHRIHYDWRFATQHDGLPDVLVNGSWKQHVLVQLVKDRLGRGGWLWKLRFRYRAMDVAGDTIIVGAQVRRKDAIDGLGFITLQMSVTNQREVLTTTGWAIGVLPLAGGRRVPYPFAPTQAQAALELPVDD
jgi:hydroxyacyl-ACP dehydratase HTD2-like protein with hotdog domain